MEKLAISHDYVRSAFDYKDGNLIRKIGRVNEIGAVAGCIHRGTGYVHIKIKAKAFKAHRLIFLYHHGFLPDLVDHIDGNKTNNKIENLRLATKQENCRNQKVRSTNKSGYKGVKWVNFYKKWKVEVGKDYKQFSFGLYDDLELAGLVAAEATELIHGRFSAYKGVLNGKT
jgi:hypothetical protein